MRYLTAGESHGKALVGIMDGCPANLYIEAEHINRELKRRQQGHGRGGRMKIESDTVNILSGVRNRRTLGSPIALMIENRDYANWEKYMSPDSCDIDTKKVTLVRPAHADLAGAIKYNTQDARNILERASARETAIRVALGAIAKRFLSELGVEIGSHVVSIGSVRSNAKANSAKETQAAEGCPVRCLDDAAAQDMIKLIDRAKDEGDTLGGVFEIVVSGMKAGYGSHTQYDRKLDYVLMGDLASLQAVKSVGIGLGARYSELSGAHTHDEIAYKNGNYYRLSNNSGGIDGGISTGENIIINCAVKPIPTLMRGLTTVDIISHESGVSAKERSDVCAVPAAAVIGEAIVALSLMKVILDTIGGDYMEEVVSRWNYKKNTI